MSNNYNDDNNDNSTLNFGVVVPGQLPITGAAFRQVSPKQWMVSIGPATEHFTVFMLSGNQPLPDGFGLACYLCRCEDDSSWTYVGHLLNERPSAMLKSPSDFMENHRGVPVFLGISLQPIAELQNFGRENELALQAQTRAARLDNIAAKLAQDFYNFVASYSRTEERRVNEDNQDDDCHGQDTKWEEVVVLPLNWVNRWRSYITNKIQKDPVMFQ